MTQLDLWTACVAPERFHPNFRRILNAQRYRAERDVVSSWSEGFNDRDGKLVQEFQTSFNSSFWELYLHSAFKAFGFSVDMSRPRPDFLVTAPSGLLAVEATTANHAEGYKQEWNKDPSIDLQELDPYEIVRSASLRLSNAIDSKARKYRREYSTLPHVAGVPFVLCVAPFDQPYFFVQNDNAIRRVLYKIDEPIWTDNDRDGRRTIWGHAEVGSATKDSGTDIGFGLFTDDRCADISGILFSTVATFCKVRALARDDSVDVWFESVRYNDHGTQPRRSLDHRSRYKETILDGLSLYINPFARRPLAARDFLSPHVAANTYDPATRQYLTNAPDGFLIRRICCGPSEQEEVPNQGVGGPRLHSELRSQHVRREWPEGQLVRVEAEVSIYRDHHLAHYRGWTVMVVWDTCDQEWGWQARQGLLRDIPEYVAAGRRQPDPPSLCGDSWHDSKEEALAAAKREIDSLTESS